MKYYKEPRDYGSAVQHLKNGKVIDRDQLLLQATAQYKTTKRLYNLRNRKKNGEPLQHPVARQPRSYKYTREQAIWLVEHTPREIAEAMNITIQRAYSIRCYARNIYGL